MPAPVRSAPRRTTPCWWRWCRSRSAGAVAASTAGAIVGAGINYVLNHRFTFASERVAPARAAAFRGDRRRRHRAERAGARGRAGVGRPALSRRAGRRDARRARWRAISPTAHGRSERACSPRVRRAAAAASSLSVVVPVYNEEAVLPEFHRRLAAVLDALPVEAEIVYVNDGSRDAHDARCSSGLHATDARVAVIDLSRNFGKEIAMSAGLDHAHGDAVVVIDADLQDPPELIPDMVRAWREGSDVVLMRRAQPRAGELAQEGDRARVLPRDRPHGHDRHPGERRRFPAAVAPRRRRAAPLPRAQPVHEGAVRVDRLSRAARSTTTATAATPARPSGTTGGCGISRSRASRRSRSCRSRSRATSASSTALVAFAYGVLRHRQDAALRRPGPRLSDADRGRAVPRRPATDGARHHRRIPGAHVHRGQAAPALPRPAMPAAARSRCRMPRSRGASSAAA